MNKPVLFFIVLLFFSPKTAQSQIIIDKQDFERLSVKNQLSFFTDSTKSLTINDILETKNQKRFLKTASESPNLGFNPNNHWFKFTIKNQTDSSVKLSLKTLAIFYDKFEIYSVINGSVEQNIDFNWRTPPSKRKIVSPFPVIQLTLQPFEVRAIYLKAQRNTLKVTVSVELASPNVSSQIEKNENILFGVLLVFVTLTSLICFVVFLIFKKKVFLFYLIQTLFSALNIVSRVGFLYLLTDRSIPFLIAPETNNLTLLGTTISLLLFSYSFFNCPKNEKKWLKYTYLTALILAVIFLVSLIYDIQFAKYFRIDLSINFFIFVFFLIIYDGLKRKDRNTIFYLIAFFPMLITIIIVALAGAKIIELPLYYDYFFPVSYLIEQVILLIGILYSLFKSQQETILIQESAKSQLIKTQEAERTRIAQDLHDDLGGTLSALKGVISDKKSLQLVDKAIFDLRNISRDLVPPDFAKQGLTPSLELFISRLQKITDIQFLFIVFGKIHRFLPDQELNIYRIITDLSHNIVKHSTAKTVTIQLIFHKKSLMVSIEDDGEIKNKESGILEINFKSINSRIEYLNAKRIQVKSQQGYSYFFELPY